LPALEDRSSTANDPGDAASTSQKPRRRAARTACDATEAKEQKRPASGPKLTKKLKA
jgi:hypothetical protein